MLLCGCCLAMKLMQRRCASAQPASIKSSKKSLAMQEYSGTFPERPANSAGTSFHGFVIIWHGGFGSCHVTPCTCKCVSKRARFCVMPRPLCPKSVHELAMAQHRDVVNVPANSGCITIPRKRARQRRERRPQGESGQRNSAMIACLPPRLLRWHTEPTLFGVGTSSTRLTSG